MCSNLTRSWQGSSRRSLIWRMDRCHLDSTLQMSALMHSPALGHRTVLATRRSRRLQMPCGTVCSPLTVLPSLMEGASLEVEEEEEAEEGVATAEGVVDDTVSFTERYMSRPRACLAHWHMAG